ncbi:hypothetical protein [Leucobacter aridicollis]|uniref:hypothetical protein n=1 Tax=Leucobacter aridicollis TaxID=283878 RepID=UPI0037C69D92
MSDTPLFGVEVAPADPGTEARRAISNQMDSVGSDLDKALNGLQGGGTLLEMRSLVAAATHYDELYRALKKARELIPEGDSDD